MRKSFVILLILTFLYVIYYALIPAVLNPHLDFFISKTKAHVELTNPKIKMGLMPAVWLMAENISLLNDDNSKALSLEHAAIKVNLLPLIFKKVQIGNFSADRLDVNLIYDGELKLGQYKILQNNNKILNKAYVRLGEYNVNLNDIKQNKKLALNGSYLLLDEFKKNKRIKLLTYAKLFAGKKESEIMADVDIKLPINKITENQFKVQGRIQNLDLADFSEYTNLKSLSGKVNFLADTTFNQKQKNIFAKLTVENLGIMKEDAARSIFNKDKIEIKTQAYTINNGLNINNLNIISDGIDVLAKGKITNLDDKFPNLDMNVDIKNSKTEKFIALLPDYESYMDAINFYALKKNPLFGIANGSLKLKGKADFPDVFGKLSIKNAYINKPILKENALLNLDFAGQKVKTDVKVPVMNNQHVTVAGDVDLYNGQYSDLIIKSTQSVDLKTAQIVLNPLHEILLFDLGPVPIMDIKGQGNIDLHIKGTRKDPHGWGSFNFQNTSASFNDIHNMVLKNGSGTLTFEDDKTHFYTKSAYLNGKPVSIDGVCTLLGDLDFNVKADRQDLGYLLNVVKTSPMLADIQKLLSPINSAKGDADFEVNLTGTIKDINDIVFNKNLFAKGALNLHSASVTAQNIPLKNLNGKINFENLKSDFDLSSALENSLIKAKGKVDEKFADIEVNSDKFILKDGFKLLNLQAPYDIGNIKTSFKAKYKGDMTSLKGLNATGKVYAYSGKVISVGNVDFVINNSNLKTSVIKGAFKKSPFIININASNLLTDKQSVNGSFNFPNFNLENLNDIKLANVKNLSGIINLKGQIRSNDIYADTNLGGASFDVDDINVKISSGRVRLQKDTLYLDKINSIADTMPVFADGKITGLNNPTFNMYINAKPNQEFADKFYNNKTVYPVKIKGDINLSSNITGNLKSLRNKTQLKLAENSNIYYMGATLGGSEQTLIVVDNTVHPEWIKINDLRYNKLIPSQNNKLYTQNQLSASGVIGFLKNNDLKFNNFKIKTHQPTDAKIFNIIFRKPLMKQGIFTSDLTINGKASAPHAIGKLDLTGIDIPLFDTAINAVDCDFKPDKIYINSKGTVLDNNLNFSAVMKNKTSPPYVFENININLKDLDLNKITTTLRDYEAENSRNLSTETTSATFTDNILIQNAQISADNIKIKNLNAQNFDAHLSLDEKMLLQVKDYRFNVAQGDVKGNIKYNLLNNLVNLSMDFADTNAQILAETLFDLKGQINGLITGSVNLSCNGKTHDACMQTLKGDGNFIVANGRMPKLGSLEYLLKAGNLVKGGITGLSINGIIDLITPYKTGEFDSIKGNFHIKEGIADSIKIYSAGKDLNIYVSGTYNFTNLVADMNVFGALTKNFSTLFGKIGNASLNTLFNTIPGINVSEVPSVITDDIKNIPNLQNASRMFAVEIYGDINGNDYVKSFRWLK